MKELKFTMNLTSRDFIITFLVLRLNNWCFWVQDFIIWVMFFLIISIFIVKGLLLSIILTMSFRIIQICFHLRLLINYLKKNAMDHGRVNWIVSDDGNFTFEDTGKVKYFLVKDLDIVFELKDYFILFTKTKKYSLIKKSILEPIGNSYLRVVFLKYTKFMKFGLKYFTYFKIY